MFGRRVAANRIVLSYRQIRTNVCNEQIKKKATSTYFPILFENEITNRMPSPPGPKRIGENHMSPITREFGSRVFMPK